jgi:hypothetical protein
VRRRREAVEESADPIDLACAVPDAIAVHDADGNPVGWDESAVHAYEIAHGLLSLCDADCVARGHVTPW